MKHVSKKNIISLLGGLSALLVLTILPSFSVQSYADDNQNTKKVKVAADDSGIFFTLNSDGEPVSGFAYEYIETIAAYSGWEVEYIPTSNFGDCFNMLLNGDIDLFYDVSYSPERANQILYPGVPMGMEEYYLYCLPNNDQIHVMDYSSYAGKKVGVTAGTYQIDCIKNWAKKNNISFEIVEYDSISDKEADLQAGKIDFDFELSMLANRDYSAIEKIDQSEYYLVANINRTDILEDINSACSKITSIDRNYFNRLEEKYFSDTLVSKSLTKDEAEWVSSHDKIRIGYMNNYLPFSSTTQSGYVTGMVKDLMPLMLYSVGIEDSIQVQYKGFDDNQAMYTALQNDEVDCIFPACGNVSFANEMQAIFSSAVISSSVDLVFKGIYSDESISTIAVNKNNLLQEFYTKYYYPDSSIILCDSVEECVEKVYSGKAGSTIINGMRTSGILSKRKYTEIHTVRLPENADFSFAVKEGNSALISLLNRANANTDDSTVITLSFAYLADESGNNLIAFFRNHPEYLMLILLVLFALALAFFLYKRVQDMKNAERIRKEQIGKMASGVSLYIVNIVTGKIQIISQDEYLSENYTADEDYTSSITRYIETDVYESDKESAKRILKLDNIVNHLEKEDEYTERFRDISRGYPRWFEMRSVMLSDSEILLGFSDKDIEICEQLVFDKMRDKYIGLFYINFDTGLAQILKSDSEYVIGKSGTVIPFETLMNKIALISDGEEAKIFNRISDVEYLKKFFGSEDLGYTTYKSHILNAEKWINLTGLVLERDKDGRPSLLGLGFSLLDDEACEKEEAKKRLAESMEVVGGLAEEYTSLYHVNLDTGEYVPYQVSGRDDILKSMYVMCTKFIDLFRIFTGSELVMPEDRELLENFYPSDEAVKEALSTKKMISTLFKRNYDGEFLWTEMSIIKCETSDADAHNVIIGFIEKNEEINDEAEKIKESQEAERLIENIAAGYNLAYVVNMVDDSFRLLKIDEGIIGENEEFATFSEAKEFFLSGPLHPSDRAKMTKEMDYETIKEKLENTGSYSIEYRALINNCTIWHEMNITLIGTDEIAVGFGIRDPEIAIRHLEEKKYDELFALFEVDLDTDRLRIIKNEQYYRAVPVGESVPYMAFMRQFSDDLDEEPKRFIRQISNPDYLKLEFATDDKRTFSYKSTHIPGEKWVEVSVYVILRHENGSPAMITIGFSLVDAMATLRQEVQAKLRKAYGEVKEAHEAAERANQSKTSFLFNMSHDIRTPMNAITGFTNMAKKHINNKEKVEDYLNKIDTSGQQLLSLINQVLEMARIESGKIDLDEKPVNVRDEFDAAIIVLAEQAEANGLEFHHSLMDVRHNRVLADIARMDSITLNIAGNAMKYTPRGGCIDFILKEISARKEGYATFVFTVSDTGIGMSEEYLKVLFDPFTREKTTTVSKIQGTGLGMSIVKDLVDFLGGNIEVQSELGKGTRFDVTIDFKIDDSDEIPDTEQIEVDRSFFEGKKVLLVEDNELNREIVQDILDEVGIIAEEADDGSVAVEMMKEKGADYYDFILMDVQMPIMNGYEATKRIREMYPGAGIPIIALSANAFAEDRDRSIAAGMNDHVAKPINIDQLFAVLSKFI